MQGWKLLPCQDWLGVPSLDHGIPLTTASSILRVTRQYIDTTCLTPCIMCKIELNGWLWLLSCYSWIGMSFVSRLRLHVTMSFRSDPNPDCSFELVVRGGGHLESRVLWVLMISKHLLPWICYFVLSCHSIYDAHDVPSKSCIWGFHNPMQHLPFWHQCRKPNHSPRLWM